MAARHGWTARRRDGNADFLRRQSGDDDVIVFARTGGGLWEVPAGGGTVMRRTETDTAAVKRALDQVAATPITYTDRAVKPFFSPAGEIS